MKKLNAGSVVLEPETLPEREENVKSTKWIVKEKKTDKSNVIKTVGAIWFASEVELGTITVDFALEQGEERLPLMKDALLAIVEWSFASGEIYQICASSRHDDWRRIDILERAGFVFRSGSKEVEEYSIEKPQTVWLGLYLLIGFVSGLILGIVFSSMLMGLVLGVLAGTLAGAVLDAKAKDARAKVTGENTRRRLRKKK